MKIRLTKEAKLQILSGIIITFSAITFYFFFLNYTQIKSSVGNFFSILFPFIVGFVIAFLLNPIMMFIEDKVLGKTKLKSSTKRTIAASVSVIIGIVVVATVIVLIASQVSDSVNTLVSNSDKYLLSFQEFVEDLFKKFNLNMKDVEQVTQSGGDFMTIITSTVSKYALHMVDASFGFVMMLFKILIGIIAGLYLLMDKEKFIHQVNKLNRAFFPEKIATYLKRFMGVLKRIFYDFIVGKAIDSFIIGIICYAGMLLLGFPYAPLLSLIVGITNMIPVFGPFIGAVPGIFLLVMIDPIQAVYFALFIFALQQFDGNFLGPYILGDKLGVPSFWILFSVTVGGSLFGIVGMFIGVPTFAAIYFLIKEFVDYRLEMKENQTESEET